MKTWTLIVGVVWVVLSSVLPAMAQEEPDCGVLSHEATRLLAHADDLADEGNVSTAEVLVAAAHNILATCTTSCPTLETIPAIPAEINRDVLHTVINTTEALVKACPYDVVLEGNSFAVRYPASMTLSADPGSPVGLYILGSTTIDLSDFDLVDDLENLPQDRTLISLLQEGLVIGVVEVTGTPDEMNVDEDLTELLADLADDFELDVANATINRTFTVNGARAVEISGFEPGRGPLAGRTMGIYAAIVTQDADVILIVAAAPEPLFTEQYSTITDLVASVEFKD